MALCSYDSPHWDVGNQAFKGEAAHRQAARSRKTRLGAIHQARNQAQPGDDSPHSR